MLFIKLLRIAIYFAMHLVDSLRCP